MSLNVILIILFKMEDLVIEIEFVMEYVVCRGPNLIQNAGNVLCSCVCGFQLV
jgi:hypothetical protein